MKEDVNNVADLQRLRDWYFDKVILKDFEGANAVSSLGKKMLSGTVQEYLPISNRDPNFKNLDFCLSREQYQQMLMDEIAARRIRRPNSDQINAWMKIPGMVDMRYRRISDYLINLTSGEILLSRLEFIAMKAAQSFVSSNINQPSQAARS